MLDPLTTIVWSPMAFYRFPIRTASIVGSQVSVRHINHFLSTGDEVTIYGEDYDDLHYSGGVTAIDGNVFSYVLPSSPTTLEVKPQPGKKTELWASCTKYSALLNYPGLIQFFLAFGTEVSIETFEDGKWVSQVVITSDDGLVDVFFDARWKDVRLVRQAGTVIPTVTAYHASSPPPSATADNTYHLPIFSGGSGGGLTPVGIPGTYDLVTTNEFGQVISGSVGGGGDKNIYTEMLNNGTSNIPKGAPVRKTGDASVELAHGSIDKKGVIGIAYEPMLIGQTKHILIEGTMTMPTGDWNVITGDSAGLINDDAPYFLNFAVPGRLSKVPNLDTAPANSYLVAVGYAISPNQLKIDIDAPIKIS